MTFQSAPEDPEYTSEPKLLSPVSPKPLHYPVPENIPVLEKQIDQLFNQTATHMSEPTVSQTTGQTTQPVDTTIRDYISSTADDTAALSAPTSSISGGGVSMEEQAQSREATADKQMKLHLNTNSHQDIDVDHALALSNTKASHDSIPASSSTATIVAATPTVFPHDATSQSEPSQAHLALLPSAVPSEGDGASGVNYQSLLDSLSQSTSTAPNAEDVGMSNAASPPSTAQASALAPDALHSPSGSSAFAGLSAGLPPRPPPQEQPSIHPNYTHSSDIRDYHPHSHNPALLPSAPHTSPATYRPNAAPSQVYPAAPFQTAAPGANGLPPPPVASFQQPHPLPPAPAPTQSPMSQLRRQREMLESAREIKQAAGEALDDEDAPWTAERQRKYDQFLTEERRYVTEGNWEQFPNGSRLFVGNLSSEKVTKRDIFHVFHIYGSLAQISIKQAYGFVQFLEAHACDRALRTEQGRTIRGKKIHLEVSKPQKNRNSNGQRRSRSPDNGRAAKAPAGVDRYVSAQPGSGHRERNDRSDRNRDGRRARDDYRPGRSPSPRGHRPRDRSRDRSDRYRSRSRSPAYGRGGRYRSPSPRRDVDDDLPLPRRAPRDVPDVQVIVLDELDRNFIAWIEQAFTARGIRIDVLLLSPRLSESAVIKRQILEGVVAVSRLTRANQQTAKMPLQVFDRRGGADVRFEEYVDLDPSIAVEVVLRAKATNATPSYGGQMQYGYGAGTAAQQPSTAAPQPPNLGNIITSLDANGLQKLLGAMQPPTSLPAHQPYSQPMLPSDLAKLLGGPTPPQPYGQPPLAQDPLAALRANPALAGLLGAQGMPPQQPATPSQVQSHVQAPPSQQGQPDMADILARLGTYRR